jgi:hypothetical protein
LASAGTEVHRSRESRIAVLLRQAANQQPNYEQENHDPIENPAMTRPSDHQSISVRERSGEHRDSKHLDEVCQRRRVFIGMGAIRVEKPAAIGAQVLDDFQRRNRSLSDGLPRALETSGLCVRMEIHRYALPRQG